MTKAEYNAWLAETLRSRERWAVDPIQWLNHGRLLFYKGGCDGHYVEIEREGAVTVGTYEGALPHIGEAMFRPLWEGKFDSQEAALAVVTTRARLPHLVILAAQARAMGPRQPIRPDRRVSL